MNKPHVHAEVIKAWADGAEVEFKSSINEWRNAIDPAFVPHIEYRIKPKKKIMKRWYRSYREGDEIKVIMADTSVDAVIGYLPTGLDWIGAGWHSFIIEVDAE